MSYREENGQAVLTMTWNDYDERTEIESAASMMAGIRIE